MLHENQWKTIKKYMMITSPISILPIQKESVMGNWDWLSRKVEPWQMELWTTRGEPWPREMAAVGGEESGGAVEESPPAPGGSRVAVGKATVRNGRISAGSVTWASQMASYLGSF